ncbi:uncharacterized protein C6orf136 homolog [Puntigrus tetrazona]|uniref:uncharacterized protein C6orf136 homolog n=1 Tax=Puntigrus tetrazona TaxID=1606681 RepID=UPI001C89F2E4|nr:uncharacterized protein C6orf136 homolog [Puntigrus tetrazona]XP_043073520.1 uncharacterized protein C6orf136 homolog [Puntigrus tetrazona]
MAVCRGGVSLWVGCVRNHGGRQPMTKRCWNLCQSAEFHLNDNCRTLSSGSGALTPPNSLRYLSIKQPSLSHPFHHSCQPNRAASPEEEEWEEAIGLPVLLSPGENDEQHTVVEVPFLGPAKLGELLALVPNRPFDLLFPLTTVDGRREDDISISRKTGTEEIQPTERGSFRSLFEAEGCPAPFMLGSRFFCFHCPETESVSETAPEAGKGRDEQSFYPVLNVIHYSHAETERVDKSSSQRDMKDEEKLALMHEKLRVELPSFFVKHHDYSIYSEDVEFINGLLNTKTRGRVAYQLTLTLWRLMCLCYYAEAQLEVLKLTKHPEDGSIKARWRVKGLPFHSVLVFFYKKDKSHLYRTYDAFSTFYIGSDGRIHRHKVEKVMEASPPLLPKVTSMLAGALVALGIQEHRPALNLLPLLLSSLRQTRA